MGYDTEFIEQISDKVDLLEYASQFYDFKRHGEGCWVTSCPNHSDSTPSLVITPSKNMFHCFGCGAGGKILQWKQTYEGCTFQQAVEEVIKLTGISYQDLKTPEAVKFFKKYNSLLNYKTTKIDTSQRKILDPKELDKFENEYPQEWVDEGISEDVLDKYKIRIDRKANRIIYPIYDNDDNLIGFKGRTRFVNFKEMGITKYQNYTKIGTSDFFVGMKENRKSILEHGTILIFEGIKSVMKADDYGYDYSVSAETSAINEEQQKILIKMGIKNVIIGFDKDVSFWKIKKSCNLLRMFCNVFIIYDKYKLLDDKMSPVDKGKEVFVQLLDSAVKI